MQTAFRKARASLEAKGVFAHGAVPDPIADSWHRCLKSGLDPKGEPLDAVISFQELREAKERHAKLIAIVRPELELLSNQIAGTNHMTAFADREGVVLDAIMDNEFRESECSRSIRIGSIWREELRGTNALGLALHAGEASMVTGSEHFFAKHGRVSCVSAPIFDSQGRIVGVLDASSEVAARQFHTQALVTLAAGNIENRIFVDEHRGEHIIQFHPREEYLTTQSIGMISLDDDGRITGSNRHAGGILKGLELGAAKSFSDLFQGGFGAALKPMVDGEVIRLVDWLNAAYFARIRATRRNPDYTQLKRTVAVSIPAVFNLPSAPGRPVFRDEQVRNSLRLAMRSARLGTPFCIIGEPGTGRTTLAQTVHEDLHDDRPLILVDCQTANELSQTERLMADILGETDTQEFSLQTGGTLLLEDLEAIRGGAAERLAQVTNRMLQLKNSPGWSIICTGQTDTMPNDQWPPHVRMAFSRLVQMRVHLPDLVDRTDFAQIVACMMADISPGHQFSPTAIEALKRIDRSQNLTGLANQLQVLAVQCPVGVIREEHVERKLGLPDDSEIACPRCSGNGAREAKCREINKVFRQCNANVALTARKLGVSRNTVYSHIPT